MSNNSSQIRHKIIQNKVNHATHEHTEMKQLLESLQFQALISKKTLAI